MKSIQLTIHKTTNRVTIFVDHITHVIEGSDKFPGTSVYIGDSHTDEGIIVNKAYAEVLIRIQSASLPS